MPGRADGDNTTSPIRICVNSSLAGPGTIRAKVQAGRNVVFDKTAQITHGENWVDWEWHSGKLKDQHLEFSFTISDPKGRVVASDSQSVEKISTAILLASLDRIEQRLDGEFATLHLQCAAQGLPLDYPEAARTTIRQFLPLEREDARGREQRRAYFAIGDMNRSLDRSIAEMRACLANPKLARSTRRYQTGSVTLRGLTQTGTRVDGSNRKDEGPLFFCGYGHFNQVGKDMRLWPGYGVNLIQHATFGPSAVLPAEDRVDMKEIHNLIAVLDDAAAHNVRVDLLISPHYWPAWPAAKWPQIATGGFLGYPVDMPESKRVLEKFLRILIPAIRDKPALHSICLSNEPGFGAPTTAANTKSMWLTYLASVHGDIAGLNARWGSSFKSFDDVPMGGGPEDPASYDWMMFCKRRFASWHGWLGDVIHGMAPRLPVHSKVAAVFTLPSRSLIGNGADYELMGRVCDYNGNDCCSYEDRRHGYRSTWQMQGILYDMQRSFNRKPVFNSENHIVRDYSTSYTPPEHFRTVLWQGAVHGQGSTTIWVWDRATSSSHTWPFYGSVMDRPGCAEAVGVTCMDLNRFADEVTALQAVPAPVAIVYSNTSFLRNVDHMPAINRAYEALNFCGVRIDFLSDDQLAHGEGSRYKLIILPQVSHLPDDAAKALASLPGHVRVASLGSSPTRNAYGRPLPAELVGSIHAGAEVLDPAQGPMDLWPPLLRELDAHHALPEWSVVEARTGKPLWGVEWLPARISGRTVVNMVNLLDKPVDVKVLLRGKEVHARDLLSFGRPAVRTLEPETPVLAEIADGPLYSRTQ